MAPRLHSKRRPVAWAGGTAAEAQPRVANGFLAPPFSLSGTPASPLVQRQTNQPTPNGHGNKTQQDKPVAGKAGQPPEKDFCTGTYDKVFDCDFAPACEAHDICYGAESSVSRIECDLLFLRDLLRICAKSKVAEQCSYTAKAYFAGVRNFGIFFYDGTGSKL